MRPDSPSCSCSSSRHIRWWWLWGVLFIASAPLLFQAPSADQKDQKIVVLDEGEAEEQEDNSAVTVSLSGSKEGVRIVVHGGDGKTQKIRIISGSDSIQEMDLDEEDIDIDFEPYGDTCVDADDIVAFGHDVHVRSGQLVPGDVVCIMGSAKIDGTVRGEVVSIGGQIDVSTGGVIQGDAVAIGGGMIDMAPGAIIQGEAVAIGGRIRQRETSIIGGERVEITFMPSFGSGIGIAGILWFGFLIHLIIVGFMGWILLLISLKRWGVSIATLRTRGWESLLAGVGGGIVYSIIVVPLLLALAVAMVAVVVGIPLVPVLVLLLLIFPVPGYLVTGSLLGLSVMGRSGEAEAAPGSEEVEAVGYPTQGLVRAFLLGHLLLSLPAFVGLLIAVFGGPGLVSNSFLLLSFAIVSLAVALGWGAFLLSRFGRRAPGAVTS